MIDMLINVYLPHFFDWLIETSLMASILVGFILCIKILFRNKLTPRWQYMLWIVLMIRLLLPWSPDSSYSIYSLLSYRSSVSEVIPKNMPSTESMMNIESDHKVELESHAETVTKSGKPEVNVSTEQQTPFSLYKLAMYVWLVGVFLLAVITFITNRRLYSYIKKQPDITDEQVVTVFNRCKQSMKMKKAVSLRLAGKIASPTVFSFFRPKVLLSKKHMKVLNEQQLQYIFYHELAHIKRNDVAVNWIMYSLILLNWFNPILWYAYFCMREDQELACDAYALTFIDKEEQIAYGHTIITLLEHYSYQAPSLANLSRNKRTLKRRIVMIKKFQKKSYRLSLLGVIVIVAIASLSLFNARATEGKEKQDDKVEQSKDAFQNAVDMLYGTEENAKKEYHYSARVYEEKTDYLYLAEKALTKDEFQQYIKLSKKIINIQKKGAPRDSDYESIFFREERLSKVDRDKLYALYDQAKPFDDKVHESLNYTVKEAQQHVDFQIKKPTYTIEGYNLKDEKVYYFIKRRPELIIELEYTNGKGNYIISQSQVFGESKDPFHALFVVEENIEQYELEGNQIYYATDNSDSNLQGIKMIVPAKGKNSAYQIVIINHSVERPGEAVFDKNVNKKELEKIMISMLK
ncbi:MULTISPECIES: M56 family metallopeptidase [Bacillus cereus group]|uniref:M56 family metallopeptidase n=1 Tax=Bacillus cereus group TaxID=86661 RepID=UPI001F48E1A4|nr:MULTISPECIES: M56 family metallopeptidase [Bacillus cereus group]MDA1517403.1 M56 family metallopeptidase [Bacillus cereus]MDA2309593.1 M56 family metallopeptidase [Bacillus cereus]MDA2316577.1 M56 family metallopeptidase [Bacillus cereus]MDA2498507.1 M56 family metallopeptidase [Bacillus cereus]MDF9610837.1 M56 family metallopeptidase [Bacillus cereus]